ncbi:hypothetical protein [Thermovenabulum sp.]|uniref:hypothetical protein n=1 Tax=Thermovenabulum sp. TaxID=3100335 RepID=UPI003C7B595A
MGDLFRKIIAIFILFGMIFTNFALAEAKTINNSVKTKQTTSKTTYIHPDKAYKLGVEAYNKKDYSKAVYYFEIAVKGNPSAANFIMLAKSMRN